MFMKRFGVADNALLAGRFWDQVSSPPASEMLPEEAKHFLENIKKISKNQLKKVYYKNHKKNTRTARKLCKAISEELSRRAHGGLMQS